jgi:hypothetical protein
MFDTGFVFRPGRLTTILDSSAGSSGKGKLGAFVTKHANNWQFACNTFFPQAGQWVREDDGTSYFYQTLNSCAHQDNFEKLFLGPGAIIELPALWRELEMTSLPAAKLGISPVCGILQSKDAAYERGECDLDGSRTIHTGTMEKGSTCHGVGACLVRRRLRRKDALLARDIPELIPYLCDVPGEIITRLRSGQAGILELAQGFQLSYLLPQFYPYCTSRNVTVAAGLDDMMVPPAYAGPVIVNVRTYPIRISNFKFLADEAGSGPAGELIMPGQHLTWEQIEHCKTTGLKFTQHTYDSGPGYADQRETTWEQVTHDSGSSLPIMEMTSVTKLPRRVFTFSRQNVLDACKHNDCGHGIYLSINFANYVDASIEGARVMQTELDVSDWPRFQAWLQQLNPDTLGAKISFIGTGARTDEFIVASS